MNFFGFLLIVGISVLFAFLFVVILNVKGPWGNFWTFFFILFLGIWAVSFWIEPIGPVFRGINWAPLVVAGFILALLMALAGSNQPKRKKRNAITGHLVKSESKSENRLNIFFWILLGILAFIIISGII